MTHAPEPSAEYVAARRVLLDALILLRDQLDAFVLVGAQAVYLRAPYGDPRPMYTTDGDLLIDPDLLARHPDLGAELAAAGFTLGRHGNPGHWISPDGIVIDLMVASGSLPPSTRRTALLAGQATTTARRTDGLELALVDNTAMTLPALDPQDGRTITLKVAGPAALVVAKSTKIRERSHLGRVDRISAKDAGDLLRLLRNNSPARVGTRLAELATATDLSDQTASIMAWLSAQTASRYSPLVRLAVDDLKEVEPEAQVSVAVRTLLGRLIDSFHAEHPGQH